MVDRYTHAVAEVMTETAEAIERALSAPKPRKPTVQAHERRTMQTHDTLVMHAGSAAKDGAPVVAGPRFMGKVPPTRPQG
jgi:hypothetical protein